MAARTLVLLAPFLYHVSTRGLSQGGAAGVVVNSVNKCRRVSAGSITASISSVEAMLIALPAS
jgi:hypothetical protein